MMEIHPERTREPEEKPKLIFPVLIWFCIIVLSIFVALQLTGCAVDVERSFRECLLHERDATYTVTRDMSKMECKR